MRAYDLNKWCKNTNTLESLHLIFKQLEIIWQIYTCQRSVVKNLTAQATLSTHWSAPSFCTTRKRYNIKEIFASRCGRCRQDKFVDFWVWVNDGEKFSQTHFLTKICEAEMRSGCSNTLNWKDLSKLQKYNLNIGIQEDTCCMNIRSGKVWCR